MDFNSLGNGNPFYVLKKGERPVLEVGVVKGKSAPRPQYQAQTQGVMSGMNFQQVIDITVTLNGSDRVIPNLPVNVEIAALGNETYSGSREAMLQAVDAMLQTSKKAIEQVPMHKSVVAESEKMLEILNPRYAEEKKQARTINDLERRQADTDKKLDTILGILQKLDSPAPSAV
ncbi:MAG: hypothetical protein II486_02940 [Thermoguttaceae bacterium]|nr:hypothetical protein [Thermoguttaceae bacterium]